MFLSKAEIDASLTWLVENASPPVKYLTHRHLLHADPRLEPMLELWRSVETSPAAEEIFSRQNADGSWFSGGPWGPRGYRRETGPGYTLTRPKFVTTAWILPFLGEMGFTAANEQVRKSCALLLEEVGSPKESLERGVDARNCCGLSAIPLRALASVGLAADARLQDKWEWLSQCQRPDGGWLNPNHLAGASSPSKTVGRWPWDRSCAWGSFYAVQALYYADDPGLHPALIAGLEFLLWHLSQKDPRDIQTWVYHGHNTVKELLMFSEAGIDMYAEPIQALLGWLKGYYRPDEGVFRVQEKPNSDFLRQIKEVIQDFAAKNGPDYWANVPKTSAPLLRHHLYHLIEDDWLTYTLTRIGMNLN